MNNLMLSVDKLNDLSICPTLFYYKHIARKTPVVKAEPLESGDLMHHGLRLYYESKMKGQTIDVLSLQELARNYATKLSLPVEVVEQTVKDLGMYVNYYQNSESWEIEAVEEPFAKELFSTKDLVVHLTGKCDLRVKTNYGKGPRVIIDHKYEGQFRTKPDRDNQPLAYLWAYEVRDFIYNRIGKQKSKSIPERLQRPYFNYTDNQINDWIDSVKDLVNRLLFYVEKDHWPMQYTGCAFHSRKCTFYDVCNTTPDNRQYKLDAIFMDKDSGKSVMGDNEE